jgi:hypothetical protein
VLVSCIIKLRNFVVFDHNEVCEAIDSARGLWTSVFTRSNRILYGQETQAKVESLHNSDRKRRSWTVHL